MTVRIINADCRAALREMPDASVQCCITSPPYFGLRDYGVAGQIGLEATIADHLEALVDVFGEVRRVLRDDGTLWVNYGDAYAGSWGAQGRGDKRGEMEAGGRIDGGISATQIAAHPLRRQTGSLTRTGGLKPKDLMGLPWRLAFALQEDGWWLRQDIIWHKPNPMPESIKDRCTKAHEYIFLLAKSERYYFDQDAIRTPFSSETKAQSFETMDFKARDKYKMPDGWDTGPGGHGTFHRKGREKGRIPGNVNPAKGQAAYEAGDEHQRTKAGLLDYAKRSRANTFARETATDGKPGSPAQHRADREPIDYSSGANKRSVWTVPTEAFKEAHFATFPPALIEPCILAGCPIGGTVLDPFGGAGTTGLVADRLQRSAVLIELNPAYAAMAKARVSGDAPLFAEVT